MRGEVLADDLPVGRPVKRALAIPLARRELAAVAPNWSAMKLAIVECSKLDEVKALSDKAIALRAYYAQSQDTENETSAMRIRLRAERRLGELIASEQEAGRLASRGDNAHTMMSSPTTSTLSDLGIPRDRSARAQELARVPEDQFEAALINGKPSARALAELAPPKSETPARQANGNVDVRPVLATWGAIRDLSVAIQDGSLLAAAGWTRHPGIQKFQVDEIRAALPVIVGYLSQLAKEE